MHSVLLIWQEVPEYLKVYHLHEDDEVFGKLKKCHDKFINSDNFEEGIQDWLIKWQEGLAPDDVVYNDSKSTLNFSEVKTICMNSPDYDVTIIVTGWVC